jgi:hypothetical protein
VIVRKNFIAVLMVACVLVLFGCGSSSDEPADPFGAATGMKGSQAMSSSDSSGEQPPHTKPVYLRNEDGNRFVILVPDPNAITPFGVTMVTSVRKNAGGKCVAKAHQFKWSDLSAKEFKKFPGDIFWVKYASKFDIKVQLDTAVASWQELIDSDVLAVFKDNYGKRGYLNMDNTWYFSEIDLCDA